MKPFEEFTLDDLLAFFKKHGLVIYDGRGSVKQIYDYEKISGILGCKPRNAALLCNKPFRLQRHHYDLLALHSGNLKPCLIA
ncbi:hypothetical protein CJF42_03560 [Pseudoalteromonas sp. NBT06-2]|nr:hypothetical protein CJF42_03560 [Pseudoalteromonas sp. NBT06-2]